MSGVSEKVVPKEGTITNRKGAKLFTRYWLPIGEARCLMCISHGFGEHLGWYDELAQRLISKGVLVFGHDHMGHGRSEGPRAIVDSVDQYVQDIYLHCAQVKREHSGLPLFLYGHSMGGMVALSAILKNSSFFKGMILEGPLIVPDPSEVTPVKILLGRLLSSILPEMQLGKIRVEQVTSDKEVQAKLTGDKLRWTGGCKLGLGMAFLRCLETINSQLSMISLPFLVVHGEVDSLCQVGGSQLLHREAKSPDKKLVIVPLAAHHLLLEVVKVREQFLQEVENWLGERVAEQSKLTEL